MKDIKGKTAFITGGASGIGLGISKVFVNAGMNVVMADIRQDHLDQAMEYFSTQVQEKQVHAIQLDVTDRKAMTAAAEETEKVFGNIHVLVNNAVGQAVRPAGLG